MTMKINETATGGAVGSASIAVRTDLPPASPKSCLRLSDYLKKGKRAGKQWKLIPFPIRVSESFDIQDVLSRLQGIETKAHGRHVGADETVTYGVEDDDGNIMKVTVRKEQGPDFESALAQELGAINAFSPTGNAGKDVSMAELLYNLKDKFNIIDVEFPTIPTDVVYNADKATYNVGSDTSTDTVTDDQTNLDASGLDDDDLDAPLSSDGPLDLNDLADEEDGDLGADNTDDLTIEPEGDADIVSDFEEEEDEGSMLDKVISMLKAQAEAEIAKANAEAEKHRAAQAEYSTRAAQATIAQEEELARMEAEMEKTREEEKRAKKLADIAKYRVRSAVTEADSGETTLMVRRLLANLAVKWAINPGDDPETRTYKTRMRANEARELQARMKSAREREIRKNALMKAERNQKPQDNQNDPNTNQGQNQASGNPNQPIADRI